MWLSFSCTVILVCVLLVAPGLLLTRSLVAAPQMAVSLSPMVSVFLYALLGTVFSAVGIPCSWTSLLVAALLPGLVLSCVRRAPRFVPKGRHALRPSSHDADGGGTSARNMAPLLLACGVGMLTCLIVYISSLASPDSFAQNYDSAYHLSRVRSFVDSGAYSSLQGGFYPSAWHCLCAMAQSATGVTVPTAATAVNFAVTALVYPMGVYALLVAAFPSNPRRLLLGCFSCTAVAFFPWRLMLFGPLYPNILSLSLVPAVCATFMHVICDKGASGSRSGFVALFVLGGGSLAFSQPNAIFSAAVFLAPFCIYHVFIHIRQKGKSALVACLGGAGLLLAFCLIWLALLQLPSFQTILDYPRDSPFTTFTALKRSISLAYTIARPQYLVGCIALLGIYRLFRERGRRWILLSYAATAFLYIVAISWSGEARRVLVGFWYSDYYRLAAAAAIFAILPICSGLDHLLDLLALLVSKLHHHREKSQRVLNIATALMLACVVVLNSIPLPFLPRILRSYAFDAVMYEMRDMYVSGGYRSLSDEERSFLAQASELVPEGELIINQPFDGSVFAYATNGSNVLFKNYTASDEQGLGLIRCSLDEYATNDAVRDTVEELGASYVLQLDQGYPSSSLATFYTEGYDPQDWVGIDSIDDSTPGFSVVLAEGDMRLYRIG